jgi:triacylglycerol lipase
VLAQIGLVSALGTARLPGMFRVSCLRGACCEDFRSAMTGPFPDEVGYVAVYSRSDGIVDWRSCLDPEADEQVEVSASHCGMGVNAQAFLAVANALARFERDDPLLAPDIAEAA